MHLNGAVAVITGGARGFGKAFSEALLKRGCKVCFAGRNTEEGEEAEKVFNDTYGPHAALFVKCDVTKDKEFRELFRQAKLKFNRVDIMVNNAGILNEELWEKTIDVNLTGTIRGTLLAVEHMRRDKGGEGGIIINIASAGGIYPAFYLPAYFASKSGVVGFTRSWANNPINKDLGLQFACLCPAFSDTAMFQQMHSANPPYLFYDEAKQIVLRNINELGINSVEDVAKTFLELVEKDNCNGDIVTLDKLRGTLYHYNKHRSRL